MLSTCRVSLLFGLAVAAAAACGGAPPAPTTPTAPIDSSMPAPSAPSPTSSASPAGSAAPSASAGASEGAAVPAAWTKDLTKPQQIAFMKAKVMPVMGPAFKGHDSTKYADFGCKTCHGPQYQTPTAFLPHLTFAGGTITSFKDKPEISKFMHEAVVPQMAGVFGQPAFDPKTKTGFGCMGCHTVDMK
jgi:hypothetical protein